MRNLLTLPTPSRLYRTACLTTLAGLCIASSITNPSDLLLLARGADRVALVCAWIGGVL
jgi:hypothetical protein